jgi:alcohol dehydrogenase class IV
VTRDFTYIANPARVLFGHGTIGRLAEELEALGIAPPLVLTTPQQAQDGEGRCHLIREPTV